MFDVQFTPRGEKELKAFPKDIQRRIQKKLRFYIKLLNPLSVAKSIANLPPATHRYRIGKYRVSFYLENKTIFVERVELRGQAYRRF